MNKATLLIGGNQGDRSRLIQQATELIQQRVGSVVLASSVYETAPWGDFEVSSGQCPVPSFLNRGLLVETPLTAEEVLREALEIEKDLGRTRGASLSSRTSLSSPSSQASEASPARVYHSRTMDIDLIFFNDEVIDTSDLQVPHPRMHLRSFVLEPLTEIMPDYRHPVIGKTVKELLQELA